MWDLGPHGHSPHCEEGHTYRRPCLSCRGWENPAWSGMSPWCHRHSPISVMSAAILESQLLDPMHFQVGGSPKAYWCLPFFLGFPYHNIFLNFIFNWMITALQYCVGFCHTSTWISHRYTHAPPNLPPTSHPIPPLYIVTEPQFEVPESYSKFPLAICFTYGSVYVSMLLSPFVPPSVFPRPVFINLFSMSLSHCCPANRFINAIFLDVLIYNICFSLSDLLQSVW